MVHFISHEESAARELLAQAGVTILREDDDWRDALMNEVLDEQSRFDRAEIAMDPPAAGQEFESFGAWHVNNAPEFHSIVSGSGILEYVTPGGVVSVVLEGGDIMAVRCAEHRYLPLTTQHWIARFGGGPAAELTPTETGRAPEPWPTL